MQTFLPYEDFSETAKCLDFRRLGKQRVECKQILMACLGLTTAWANHPNTKRWVGHEMVLCEYAIEICKEWRNRGYKDSLLPLFEESWILLGQYGYGYTIPEWLTPEFCDSHKYILFKKNPVLYDCFKDFGSTVDMV